MTTVESKLKVETFPLPDTRTVPEVDPTEEREGPHEMGLGSTHRTKRDFRPTSVRGLGTRVPKGPDPESKGWS